MIIAADGGNSKTDLALLREDGSLLALVRGPQSSPHHLGAEGALDVLERLLREAAAQAGTEPTAQLAALFLAGVDFPFEEQELTELVAARGWARRTLIGNDTFAVLRAGTDCGWGVAVVCGAGINCVGVAPDGRQARFPSLGAITGDWGGGYDLGMGALWAAARSEDGRGAKTRLERAVPAHFGLETPLELAAAIHTGKIRVRRLAELAPLVLAASDDDPVAAELTERLAGEVVSMARVALERLDLLDDPVEVVLGGGVLRGGNGNLLGAIEAGLHAVSPSVSIHPAAVPPIVGAALLALDELGADLEAHARARAELQEASRG